MGLVEQIFVTNQSKKIHKEKRKHVKDRLMSEKAMSNINREYIESIWYLIIKEKEVEIWDKQAI